VGLPRPTERSTANATWRDDQVFASCIRTLFCVCEWRRLTCPINHPNRGRNANRNHERGPDDWRAGGELDARATDDTYLIVMPV
jgi:hypothetical protein